MRESARLATPHGATTGEAVADFDRDGLDDVYMTDSGGPSTLYTQRPSGVFEISKWAEDVSLPEGGATAADAADIDGDGWPDLLVATAHGLRRFHNDTGAGFTEIPALGAEAVTAFGSGPQGTAVAFRGEVTVYGRASLSIPVSGVTAVAWHGATLYILRAESPSLTWSADTGTARWDESGRAVTFVGDDYVVAGRGLHGARHDFHVDDALTAVTSTRAGILSAGADGLHVVQRYRYIVGPPRVTSVAATGQLVVAGRPGRPYTVYKYR